MGPRKGIPLCNLNLSKYMTKRFRKEEDIQIKHD
jgi:hypothetical protein